MSTFVEQGCVFEHAGKSFESGGASILDCSDGYRRGVVYAKPQRNAVCAGTVTTWHGEKIADATFGPIYRGPFCKMRSVSFQLAGVKYTGRYCPDWAQAVRVRSTKRVT